MITTVVRRIGVEQTHVVQDVPDSMFVEMISFGSRFMGVDLPLTAACFRVLRGQAAVVMEPGTKVKCLQCRRLTGIEAQTEGTFVKPL